MHACGPTDMRGADRRPLARQRLVHQLPTYPWYSRKRVIGALPPRAALSRFQPIVAVTSTTDGNGSEEVRHFHRLESARTFAFAWACPCSSLTRAWSGRRPYAPSRTGASSRSSRALARRRRPYI
eukprot:scaffold909_cov575-Prasinococcus_capsulatus_cf.AAC.5